MNKKYKLTDEKINQFETTLFRIEALMDFSFVKKGEKGGFIEKEANLDASGDAWVYGNAWVSGDAWVYGNAWVSGDAKVYGNARVYGDAWVYGNAKVYGNARVYGDAWVYGNARVSGDARVFGNAWVFGKIKLQTALCSRFSFEFQSQVKLWQKMENQFEKESAKLKR